jgi:GntR family transcriptional regulator / MocR family aminotransferase
MAKRSATFEWSLPQRETGTPAHRWIYTTVRAKILEGQLSPGARLPGTRDLAKQHGLSRGTVVNAFDQLKSEGYLEGSVGSGTYVSGILPDELLQVRREPGTPVIPRRNRPRRISDYAQRVRPFSGFEIRSSRAFRPNLPALDLFPTPLWAQIAARRLRSVSMHHLLGCEIMGYLPLREAIANYLNTSRGVKCIAGQVLIVSGVQEALDLVARLCLNPGDRVCMEDPGYSGAALVFKALGAKISAVGLDQEGFELRDANLAGTRLIYLTPGHQFPLGITMSLPRRLKLLEWARKCGALIFEDDYDSEYRYSGRPVPALQGLDRNGRVLFFGSFSKVLFPSLRLAYLVIPPDLVPVFEAAKSITSRHAPMLEQVILRDFISEGHFGRHLRRMREVYAKRLSILLESAQQQLAGLLQISSVEAGLQTIGWLANGIKSESAAQAASVQEVEVIPLSRYSLRRTAREGLQLGFAAVDAREIRRGVQSLAIALEAETKLLHRS